MNPTQAKEALEQMGVTEPRPFGKFAIVKAPGKKDLDTFVRAVKTLGAWSVEPKRVEIEFGTVGDQVIFKVFS